jgi:localization factor PodJL
MIRLSAFHADQTMADREEKTKPRYLIPALAASLVVMVTATAMILSQRHGAPEPMLVAPTHNPALTAPAASVQASALPLPQTLTDNPATDTNPPDDVASITPHVEPTTEAPQEKAAPGRIAAKNATASASGDRVTQLATAGNPIALTILGLKALDGGTASGLPDAVRFLTQAADKGLAVAQYRLGTLYERGQGVAADSAKAMHWYELAANQGNRKAMHNLAVAYASGPGAKRNMTEAARWFAKAAALGLSDSQFNLAVLYERGEGVPQSLADAYKWYAVAALSGDAEAKARMGVLETQLNDTDRSAAKKSAMTFRAAPLNRSVNVPPEPADLGT